AAEVVQRLHAPMPSYGRDLSQPESQLAQTIKAGMVQSPTRFIDRESRIIKTN
ncbi:hypothetical protein H6F54_16420, partial [Coleofasciculus sp. FACHB-501]|nr:hypothetical protein [Coleofasciculus sp. FACHB-501]